MFPGLPPTREAERLTPGFGTRQAGGTFSQKRSGFEAYVSLNIPFKRNTADRCGRQDAGTDQPQKRASMASPRSRMKPFSWTPPNGVYSGFKVFAER